MGLKQDLEMINKRIDEVQGTKNNELSKKKSWKPRKNLGKARRGKKKGLIWVVFVDYNNEITFPVGEIKEGMVKVGDNYYDYDPTAIKHYRKVPVVIVFAWRIITGGGVVDKKIVEHKVHHMMGGEEDVDIARDLNMLSHVQQITVRSIKLAEIEREDNKKKKGGIKPVVWIIIGVVVLYLLGSGLGLF